MSVEWAVCDVLLLSSGLCLVQEEPERLGDVVASLRQLWGLKHIYCWHGLAAYWSGVAPGLEGFCCLQLPSQSL